MFSELMARYNIYDPLKRESARAGVYISYTRVSILTYGNIKKYFGIITFKYVSFAKGIAIKITWAAFPMIALTKIGHWIREWLGAARQGGVTI